MRARLLVIVLVVVGLVAVGLGGLLAWTTAQAAQQGFFTRRLTDTVGLQLVHWSHAHDAGQAFEAWIVKEAGVPTRRLLARLRSNQYVSMCRRLFASN